MCGIIGFFSFHLNQTIDKHVLFAMTESLSHRGPDGQGCVLFNRESGIVSDYSDYKDKSGASIPGAGHVGLGHRRLSIIDLSAGGHQPMSMADGLVWMIYNGEVYNYIELRKELESKGYTFTSTSDSEVVLKSYYEWGEDCFEKFNGMWAICIYDRRHDRLVLSRDRFGKKPLFYQNTGKYLIFASELKALFKMSDFKKEINLKKIVDYAGRHYRYVDDDNESFFQNVFQVPKSSYMTITRSGDSYVKKYWELTPALCFEKNLSEKDTVEQFRDLLMDAIKIRLRSDVPVASMLSGGLDSGSITCIAASLNRDFRAFSGVTGTGYYDESEYIQETVQHSGVNSVLIYPKASELIQTLREMLTYHDEPVCTVTWYSNYVITRQIAEYNVPVVLTGHGGDELLAGYWDHYHYNFSDLRCNGRGDEAEFKYWLCNHGRSNEEYIQEKAYIKRLHRNYSIEIEKYSQYLSALSPSLESYMKKEIAPSPFSGDLSRRLYLELFYETVPPSLRAEDRNMMAFSIENRLPLLDYRLAEFCFNLDSAYKIRNGLGKWLLREAMKGILPEKVRLRKDKTGFNAPFDEWIRNENRNGIEDMLSAKSYINSEIYDISKVKELFSKHMKGENHYMFFWQYINLNLWHELYF